MQFKNSVSTKQMNKIILGIITSVALSVSSFADTSPDIMDQSQAAEPAVQAVLAAQEVHTPSLMLQPGVMAVGVGVDDSYTVPTLVVLVDKTSPDPAATERAIHSQVRDVPVKVIITEPFVPQGNMAKQTFPISLGTSGGWTYDEPSNNSFCCVGTLGSLVNIAGVQYILSNWHVLEGDVILGDNNRIEQNNDPVLQPDRKS